MVHDVEVSGELLIFRYSDNGDQASGDGKAGEEKVRGLWMHEDAEGTRKINADMVMGCWEKARKAKLKAAEKAAQNMVFGEQSGIGIGAEGTSQLGRRISLTDLFGGNA